MAFKSGVAVCWFQNYGEHLDWSVNNWLIATVKLLHLVAAPLDQTSIIIRFKSPLFNFVKFLLSVFELLLEFDFVS